MSNLHSGDLKVTGSSNTKEQQKKRLSLIVRATIARRKLKAMGVVIVGVTDEEVIEFCKWYVSERSKQCLNKE